MTSNSLAFARGLLATNLKATTALRGAFVMQVRVHGAQQPHLLRVLVGVDAARPGVRGWHLGDVELLFGLVAVAFGLTVTVAGGVRHLGRFIEDGDLDTLLTQPRSVLVYALGIRSQPSGVGDVASGVVLHRRVGPGLVAHGAVRDRRDRRQRDVFLATGIAVLQPRVLAWKVETIARQLWELLITFSLYPEPLFGGVLRLALFTILPAGFVGYLPVAIVRAPSLPLACLLAAAAAVYLALAVLVFDRGLRRYASGSRFSTFG